jgi:polyhydroxyalkanoate synthase subunit PhaC
MTQPPNSTFPSFDPVVLQELKRAWQDSIQSIYSQSSDEKLTDKLTDKRFSHPSWQQDKVSASIAATYLANSAAMLQMVDAMQSAPREKQKIRMAVQQWIDACSPANFLATNPEAVALLNKTQGQSLVQGFSHLFADMQKGKLSQNDDTQFEVGRNIATTPGAVVFENELIQLIQYQPVTPTVGKKPMLMVPPCINKFYILDLQPEGSLVRHLLDAGHSVFMVSWRNVQADQGHLSWDDYLQLGVCDAIDVVKDISAQDSINLLGFCVGGTLLVSALSALAAKKQKPAHSVTLLTTFLDFSETGALGLMVDEQFVQYRESQLAQGGILKGQELATTFSFLRPNDLVWNYVVNNYLKGEPVPAFDLLYWNGDSTNLAGPMYAYYLRQTYLENNLRQPGKMHGLGVGLDLNLLDCPVYVFNTREDHIVPWVGGYESTQLLKGPVRFVLGASGHIAGVINPAKKNKRCYWVAPNSKSSKSSQYPKDANAWLTKAQEQPGSWWNDWTAWLKPLAGTQQKVKKLPLGNRRYKPIEPAPGRYVKQKAH